MKKFFKTFLFNTFMLALLLSIPFIRGIHSFYEESSYILIIIFCMVLNLIISIIKTMLLKRKK